MSTFYLRQRHQLDNGVNMVFDDAFHAVYLVAGRSGKKHDEISVYDMSGNVLVRIEQTSFGILPRFNLRYHGQVIGSISLTFGHLGDFVFIRKLNWLISGNFIANRYIITHNTKKLLSVKPSHQPDGIYNKLNVTYDTQAPLHIAIVALLDIWGIRSSLLRHFKWLPSQKGIYNITMSRKC